MNPPFQLEPESAPVKIEVSSSFVFWNNKRQRGLRGHAMVSDLCPPKSLYQNWKPPMELPVSTETHAISELSEAGSQDWNEVNLDHFTIYRQRLSDHEMEPLHHLNVKTGCKRLFFDGILSVRSTKHYVQTLPFEILSIDGYGDANPSISAVWIQTRHAKVKNVWYRLGTPTSEYSRFYHPFRWIANFGKLFVDYLLEHNRVELKDFRHTFCEWLFQHYEHFPQFQQWYQQYNCVDFRSVVSAYHEFLWKEATSVDDNLRNQFIWREIDSKALQAIKPQRMIEVKTVVTPFIYECFKDTYFSSVLDARYSASQKVISAQHLRKSLLGFSVDLVPPGSSITPPPENTPRASIRKGNVVSVLRDSVSDWKDRAELWFGKHFS
jgi:DNA (cytosine-5)-methyltransferase 1